MREISAYFSGSFRFSSGGEIGSTCIERLGFCSVLFRRYRAINIKAKNDNFYVANNNVEFTGATAAAA